MIISLPLDAETELGTIDTNVVDTTPEFDNTVNENLASEASFQENGSIYDNTTGDTIPVLPYSLTPSPAYEINDLVYKDDGAGTDRVHQVTTVSGDHPIQPEDYAIIDTSFDASTWVGRYLYFKDISVGLGDTESLLGSNEIRGMSFTADGLNLYYITYEGSSTNVLYHYTLTSAYDITTATYEANETFSVNYVSGLYVHPNGTSIYFTSAGSLIHQYNMSANDLSTLSSHHNELVSFADTFFIGNSGFKLYMKNSYTGRIYQYNMSSAYDLSTIGASWVANVATNEGYYLTSFWMNSTGSLLYTCNSYTQEIVKYSLGTVWDITTLTHEEDVCGATNNAALSGIAFNSAGTKMITVSQNTMELYSSNLDTAWTLDTAVFSIFPAVRVVYRSGVKYKYTVTETAGVYTFTSQANNLYRNTQEMTIHSYVDEDSYEPWAYAGNGTWVAQTMISRPDGLYFRTSVDVPVEIDTITSYQFSVVNLISTVNGFDRILPVNGLLPFDSKNYTRATSSTTMTYTLTGLKSFDTLALGQVKAEHIMVEFVNVDDGTTTVIDVDIDSSRDNAGNLGAWYTTLVYYADEMLPANSTVHVTLTQSDPNIEIELSILMLGVSADAGFTNLSLKNTYKDFSVFEYDDFGNTDYTERAKVSRYSGTVDVEIEDYDKTDRLMTSLGKGLLIVNGSDARNSEPDSLTIFSATQKIGRFLNFEQKTNVADNDMDVVATYSFTLEETV